MKKPLNAKERLMSEYILLGGGVMTRAIDVCVFGSRAQALTDEDLLGFARNELIFALRCEIIERSWA